MHPRNLAAMIEWGKPGNAGPRDESQAWRECHCNCVEKVNRQGGDGVLTLMVGSLMNVCLHVGCNHGGIARRLNNINQLRGKTVLKLYVNVYDAIERYVAVVYFPVCFTRTVGPIQP